MSAKIILAPSLARFANIPAMIDVNGNNLAQCLEELINKYPQIKPFIFDPNDHLLVVIYINDTSKIVYKKSDLDIPVKDGDVINLLEIIAGG